VEDAISSTEPETATAATAVVFEERPRWGPELERQFANEDVCVVECRSLSDVAERSADVARGVIVLDIAFQTAECLRFLGRRLGSGAGLPVFIVGSEQTSALEWPVRDLGATAFFAKTIPGHEMAHLCRRQWAQSTR
jgi:DNA-binding NtrC family response regulator